jgi:hypothetical protein
VGVGVEVGVCGGMRVGVGVGVGVWVWAWAWVWVWVWVWVWSGNASLWVGELRCQLGSRKAAWTVLVPRPETKLYIHSNVVYAPCDPSALDLNCTLYKSPILTFSQCSWLSPPHRGCCWTSAPPPARAPNPAACARMAANKVGTGGKLTTCGIVCGVARVIASGENSHDAACVILSCIHTTNDCSLCTDSLRGHSP